MTGITVQQSRTLALTVDDAYARTIEIDLPLLFDKRHGPIPPIVEVRDQTGPWERSGLTRTLVLGDGATMREELTAVNPPHSFSYRITEPTGPFGLLIDHADGKWAFEPSSGAGTTVTWSWTIHPRSRVLTPAVHVFGIFWRGMARKALAALETRIVLRD